MELLKSRNSDKENSVKYVLKEQDTDIGYGYIYSREVNPIEIYVYEKYQSNGYGKALFNFLLNELKQSGVKGAIFELDESQYRFKNIISQAGAFEIGRNLPKIKYVLKIL